MELTNVSKSYGETAVLRSFSASFPQGSITAVMAPSGGGKTTLLRLILGLERPDSGSITGIPKRKSALFQEDRLCPELSAEANIRMAVPGASAKQIAELLSFLGLESIDIPASQLSGGMARRAALARALLCPGELLTLDEPFNGLDEQNRLLAAEAICRWRAGRTVILVTHRREDAALLGADRILQLPVNK